MTTSGTVGATTLDVTNIIEHSFRRCGKLASTISSELQLSAKENLYFLLSSLANRGISLWCVQKNIIGLLSNTNTYTLPIGTVDLLNVLYRTQTALDFTPISGTSYYGGDLGSAQVVSNASITFSSATSATLYLEYSSDGNTWTQIQSFPVASVAAGTPISVDVDNTTSAQYWRVVDASGTIGTVSELVLSNTPTDLPISALNRDDYASLPNKTFVGSKALNYFFNKQINPTLTIWPQVVGGDQLVVWTHRQIQDVGTLTNTIEIPQRWQESIIFSLACRVAIELPPGELPQGRLEYLEGKAAQMLAEAEAGETDGNPYKLQPSIRGYTR